MFTVQMNLLKSDFIQDFLIVALKSEEIEGKVATYLTVFNMDGVVIYPETKIGDRKFEGVEFV